MAIERLTLRTTDGVDLEAEVHLADSSSEPWGAVTLAHPHPEYGGSMDVPLIQSLFDALPAEGVATLRFNFRGVGRSRGSHGDGMDERQDVEAAVAALASAAAVPESAPLVAVGWSFGADVSLCVTEERIAGWFAMAPPLRSVPLDAMDAATDPRPKLLAVPEHDQFRPPAAAREVTASWTATRIEVVSGTDHFFAGAARRLTQLCLTFLHDVL